MSDLDKKVVEVVNNQLSDLKKIMMKVYSLQKRTSGENKVNLSTAVI